MDFKDATSRLARANRIIANEGVLDAFGHVSIRNPINPNTYLLSRSRSPELIQAGDLLEFTLDSVPVRETTNRIYGERFIHGELYKARPDVMAICHHHAASMLPFCVSGIPPEPVFHLGATMGRHVPVWDARDEFGNTALIVDSSAQGASLARTMDRNWTVLMRRHGVVTAGRSLEELVFRTIYSARNAALYIQAKSLGEISALNEEEAQLASDYNLRDGPLSRAWELWNSRLDKAEGVGLAR
jgi:ribulose-5-phosphate 4-epimerase/fuculose-1-phosphate aldolase